jgi:hypothetical protein
VKSPNSVFRCVAVAVSLMCGMVYGYDGPGHHLASRAEVAALPAEMPAFFRAAGQAIASGSLDPDIFKLEELPQLRNAEYPEHYFDLELLRVRRRPPCATSSSTSASRTDCSPPRSARCPTHWLSGRRS